MAMNKNFRIGILALTMLLIGSVFAASASANSSQDTLPRGAIFEFNDSNSQRMPLPDFGPHVFDELKKNPISQRQKAKSHSMLLKQREITGLANLMILELTQKMI